MSKLIVISNRVAIPGKRNASPGGLAVGLEGALKDKGGVWFGWSGEVSDEADKRLRSERVNNIDYITVDLTAQEYDEYYSGFSNGLLWPLFHYVLGFTKFSRKQYIGYRQVNQTFAQTLKEFIGPDDIIWVHDYHLIPIAHELKALGINNRIGFFLHVPFPNYGMLRSLPIAKELIECICDFDVVGFQTEDDLTNFKDAACRSIGAESLQNSYIKSNKHLIFSHSYPIGVDLEAIQKHVNCIEKPSLFAPAFAGQCDQMMIVGADRIDYSKGLIEKMDAYEHFLSKYPEYHHHVSMVQIATLSRADDPDYIQLRENLERKISHINGCHGAMDWLPVHYLNRNLEHNELMKLFRSSKVCLVTSLRDGMNLVAKEYIAAQNPEDPGVLILSELAGASAQLVDALIINPYDIDSIAEAIAVAVKMPLPERQRRHQNMLEVIKKSTIQRWRANFIDSLVDVPRLVDKKEYFSRVI